MPAVTTDTYTENCECEKKHESRNEFVRVASKKSPSNHGEKNHKNMSKWDGDRVRSNVPAFSLMEI